VVDHAAPAVVEAPPSQVEEAVSEPEPAHPHLAFERQLGHEILVSERFRATLLAILPTVAMLVFLAASSASPDAVAWMLHGKFDRIPVGLFLCAVAGFEFYVLSATERMLRDGARPSALRRYGTALVETSLPTVVIVY
jgi:adenylate cyclase